MRHFDARTRLCMLGLGLAAAACGPAERAGAQPDGSVGASPDGSQPGDPPAMTFVYAHTSSTLYRVDPESLAVTPVGAFAAGSGGGPSITDIAIDRAGVMIGISFSSVYRIDPATAMATPLASGLAGGFNGLSFVPADQLGTTGDDVLVATRNTDGAVFRIDPATGATTQIGDMAGFASSGDLVSVANFGTVQTADNGVAADRLVRLAPGSFAATPIGTDIGFSDIWGIAYWKDKIFGFTEDGQFITIDPTTGVGTLVQGNGPAWWGAAVTTLAPVIL